MLGTSAGEEGSSDGDLTATSDENSDTEWLKLAREDPNGLASLIAGQNLELHRRLARERERVAYLNRADQPVRTDLSRANLSLSSVEALRAAKVPLTRLNAAIQYEIRAGRWSLRQSSQNRTRSENLTQALNLTQAFNEVVIDWQKAVTLANASLEELVQYAQTAFDGYESDAGRMQPGANSYLAPFAFPQKSYVGDQLASDAAYSYKRRSFPRWLMQVNVLPDRPWASLPRIDLCDKNLVFMPDGPNLSYGEASLAVQGIVADQMSRSAPNCLKITWIDALHNGQSAGPFLSLTEGGSLIIDGQVWTHPDGIESALLRVINRMANLERSCLKNEFEDLDAYNAHAGTSHEAHQIVVVAGYPYGFRGSSARLLRQISANSRRAGLSMMVIMDTSMASVVRLVDSFAPSYAEIIDGPGPANGPNWWSLDLLPLGEFVLGHSGLPYARIDTIPGRGSAWIPCNFRSADKAIQLSIINGYAQASRQLAESGLSPRELEREQLDPAARTGSLRSAMIRWLCDQIASSLDPPDWNSFLQSGASYLGGAPYTPVEIAKQASYLYDQGYIVAGVDSQDSTGMSFPCLTSKGEDMAMMGDSDLDDFAMASSRAGTKTGKTTNYYGPIFQGDASGARLAWNNHDVQQNQQSIEQVAPGFENLARAVAQILARLPQFGLTAEDSEDAAASANEILAEVVSFSPDRGRIRRALAALKGFLLPVANQAALGAGEGVHELAKAALEHLQNIPF